MKRGLQIKDTECLRYKQMSRPQFIHHMKDMLFIALERTGGTDEFETITRLVIEDGEPQHRGTFLNTIERMYRTWGKDYYGKGKPHDWLMT